MDDPTIPEEYKNKPLKWYKDEYLKLLAKKIAESERKRRNYMKKKEEERQARLERNSPSPPPKPRGRPRKYRSALDE